eukprot:4971157-Alexandrium_andersonii.AAC.1
MRTALAAFKDGVRVWTWARCAHRRMTACLDSKCAMSTSARGAIALSSDRAKVLWRAAAEGKRPKNQAEKWSNKQGDFRNSATMACAAATSAST